MFRNIVLLWIAFVCIGSLSAQKLYTPQQEKEFAQLYLSQVNIMSPTAEKQYELLTKYNISLERYRVILTANKNNESISLNENESAFWKEVKNINQETFDLKALKIKQGLEDSKLSIEDYNDLLEKYKTDRAFAQKIQEYFKK